MISTKTVLYVIGILLITNLRVFAQEYTYPNELKGFELFKNGNWKSLKPLVSTKEDVIKIFGQDCSKSCDYNENWRLQLVYIGQCSSYSELEKTWIARIADEMLGKYSNIIFYPKNRINRSRLKFGKQFKSSQQETSHSVPVMTNSYADDFGLIYTLSGEDTADKQYQKGDLVRISYSWTDTEYEKYKPKVNCETNAGIVKPPNLEP